MRNVILAVALLALAALATVATLGYKPAADGLARAEGYSVPAAPSDQPETYTATVTPGRH